MAVLDAFPFDNELEIVENVGSDEDGGYYDALVVPMSKQEEPGYDSKAVTKRGRGRPRKNSVHSGIGMPRIVTTQASKNRWNGVTGKLKKSKILNRKPTRAIPNISDLNEHDDFVQRSLRNRGKVTVPGYRPVPFRKSFCRTTKRNAIEAVNAGMSVKKAARIYKLPEMVVRNMVCKVKRQEKAISRVDDVQDESYSSDNNLDHLESDEDNPDVMGSVNGTKILTNSPGDDNTLTDDMKHLTRSNFSSSDNHDEPQRTTRLDRIEEAIRAIRVGRMFIKSAAKIYNIPLTTLRRKLKLEVGNNVEEHEILRRKLKLEVGNNVEHEIVMEAIGAIREGRMSAGRAAKFYQIPDTTLRRKLKLGVGNTVNERGSNDQGGNVGCPETNGADKERFGHPESQEDGASNDLMNSLKKLCTDTLEEPITDECLLNEHNKSRDQYTDDMKIGANEPVKDQCSDNRGRLRDRGKFKVDDYFSTPRKKWTRKSYSLQSLTKAIESYKAGMTMGKAADLHNVNVNFLSTKLQEEGLLPSTSHISIVESPGLEVDYSSVSGPSMSRKSRCNDVKDGALLAEIQNYVQLLNTCPPFPAASNPELTGLQGQNMLTIGSKLKNIGRSKDHQELMTISGNLQPWTLAQTGAVEESVEECEVPGTLMLSHSVAQTEETDYSSHSRDGSNIITEISDNLGRLGDRGKTDETNNVRQLRSHKKLRTNSDDRVCHFNKDGSLIESKITGYGVEPRLNKLYTNELLSVALEDIKAGRMSCRKAADHYNIPHGSLRIKYKSVLSSTFLASSNESIGLKQVGHSQPTNQPDGSGFNEANTDKSVGPPVKRGPTVKGRPCKMWKDSSNDFGNRSRTETGDCSSIKSSDTKHPSDTNSINTNENDGLGHPRDSTTQYMTKLLTLPDKINRTDYLRRLRSRKTIKINTCDHVNHWKNGSVEEPKNTSFGVEPQLNEHYSPDGLRMAQEDTNARRISCYDAANHYNSSHTNAPSILELSNIGQAVNQNDTINDSGVDKTGAESSSPEMRSDESQVLICASCDYETHLKSRIKRHVVKHLRDNWLKCPKCGFTEENPQVFYKHYLCHEILQRAINAPGSLVNSKMERIYTCPFCSYKSRKCQHVAKHVTYHRKYPDMYDCRKCDFSTARSDHLERHKSLHHQKNQDKIDKTENLRRTIQTSDVNYRKNGSLVEPKNTGVGASTHKQYMERLIMTLEDSKAGKTSCSDDFNHYNIPYVTLLNKHTMSECQESGPSGTLSSQSTALEQSGDEHSVNQNNSIGDKTAAGESVSPPAKRGRGRPRKYPVDREGIIKRGRPRKFPVDTEGIIERGRGRPPNLPLGSIFNNVCIDLNVRNALRPSLGNHYAHEPKLESSKCSDINMPNHLEVEVESLEGNEKIESSSESQSHMPVTSCPELQPGDSDCKPRMLEEVDCSQCQHLTNNLHPSSSISESPTEKVCQVDPIQERPLQGPSDTLQVCSYGSRSVHGSNIASSRFKKDSWNLRDLMPDCSPDHKLDIPYSYMPELSQPENPSHSNNILGMPDLPKFEENTEVPAPASGTPILDILPEPFDVQERRTSQSDALPDDSELCPNPGMPVLDRAPTESLVSVLPDILEGQDNLSYCFNLPTTESFPTPPILIPLTPVRSAIIDPAVPNSLSTPTSP